MAILKHIASKNADFREAQWYLIFQHNEYTGKPFLDENVKMQLREEFYLDGIECAPFRFDMECKELNADFHKKRIYDEIKSHHYIISFDPKDNKKRGLTGEMAKRLGLESCIKNFLGHQALVCTHTDGHNGSGNIHLTNDYLSYLKQSLMDLCQRENLPQVDLFAKAELKVTEKEYHAKRSGQK